MTKPHCGSALLVLVCSTATFGSDLDRLPAASPYGGPSRETARVQQRHFPEQTARSNDNWGPVLTDIARHLPAERRYQDAYRRYMRVGDMVTAGHEWTHFINEHLSFRSPGTSAYYVLDNKYFTLSDPEGLRGIVPHVPHSLRGYLYELYLVQNSGNARVDPLYLLDEWTAYANDVAIAVDQLEAGKPLNAANLAATQPQTAANVLEFTFYGFAVGMAVKRHDPRYYAGAEGQKLRDFIAWNAQRSIQVHRKALQRHELADRDSRNEELIRNFRASPDTAAMRAWVRSDLSTAFADMLMGADGSSEQASAADRPPSAPPVRARRAG